MKDMKRIKMAKRGMRVFGEESRELGRERERRITVMNRAGKSMRINKWKVIIEAEMRG